MRNAIILFVLILVLTAPSISCTKEKSLTKNPDSPIAADKGKEAGFDETVKITKKWNIGFDNFNAGKALGKLLAKRVKEGNVIILSGPKAHQNATDRANGTLEGLQEGKFTILEYEDVGWGDNDLPLKKMEEFINKYNKIDVVVCSCDQVAVDHVIPVLEKYKREKVVVTGFDATTKGIQAISEGKLWASIHQPIDKMAAKALLLLLRHLETGESYPRIINYPASPIVTKENVHEYQS